VVFLDSIDVNWSPEGSSIKASYIDAGSLYSYDKIRSFPFRFKFGCKVVFYYASPDEDLIFYLDYLILDTLVIIFLLLVLCFDYVVPGFLSELFCFQE